VGPYAAFNLKMAGFIFPTTFYAKQAEYRVVIESLSLPARFVSLLVAVLAGPQILLIPGFLFGIGHSLRQRAPVIILLWLWWVCLVSIYALRLPVAYQHGRYLIPTVPVFILLGTWGTWQFLRRSAGRSVTRIAGRTWGAAIVVLFILFWLLGARAYISDVGFINGEMGEMAGWLAKGIPPEARLAVHDIGLVGYRLERPFIDLAGLITPEVIPFISDEKRLLAFMESQQTDYLVLFPDWSDAYHRMVQDPRLTLVHTTGYTWTLSLGRRNLSAYHVDWSR
jgi:hypothetical protein